MIHFACPVEKTTVERPQLPFKRIFLDSVARTDPLAKILGRKAACCIPGRVSPQSVGNQQAMRPAKGQDETMGLVHILLPVPGVHRNAIFVARALPSGMRQEG